MGEKTKKISLKLALLGIFLVAGQLLTLPVQAATQYFSPNNGSYSANATFSVSVYTTSADQPASAFSGYITFPADKLSVTSVSKAGSIISIWVQEPAYSNSAGTVSFEGFIPNPGYTGSGGKLITITFQTKGSGTANLAFSNGSILANDGQGTNITSGLGGAAFTLGQPTTPAEPEKEPEPTVPRAPSVSSSTHPSRDVWYANNDPRLAVSLPAGVKGVSSLFNQSASSDPGTTSDGVRSNFSYNDVADGTWFFHVRLQNDLGWGNASHFRIQIDTVAPTNVQVVQLDPEVATSQPTIDFSAADSLSGIDYYTVAVDTVEVANLKPEEVVAGVGYTLPAQTAGLHTVTVTAFDKAGNSQLASLEVDFAEGGVVAPEPTSAGFGRLIHSFLLLLQAGILSLVWLVIAAAAVLTVIAIIHFFRHHTDKFLGAAPIRRRYPWRLRRTLRRLRHDIHLNLHRLENARRIRGLSEQAEHTIRITSRALVELEDKINRSLNDL